MKPPETSEAVPSAPATPTLLDATSIVQEALVLSDDVDAFSGDPHYGVLNVETAIGEFTITVAVAGSEAPPSLSDQHGGTWGEHPEHPFADWQYEVSNNDTRIGYWDWVAGRLSDDS